jgi:ABC-type phosphate/phosphonate transport system permease subunit
MNSEMSGTSTLKNKTGQNIMNKTILKIVFFGILNLNLTQAETRRLTCTTGQPFESFTAVLNGKNFETDNEYFHASNPRFIDNYLTLSKMTCEGSDLRSLTCVGFAFMSPRNITSVQLIYKSGEYFATMRFLTGNRFPMHDGPWPCTLE